MIPIYLEMKAFGPYAGQEIVDFRELGDHKLFLIYGPTGSGKTTILDAMCYALYGSTSGDSRTGAHMRSEYASPQEATAVSFRFAIGRKYYRIDRSPEQEIAKKRGTGLKKAAAHAALYETDEDGAQEQLVAAKNVTAAVERLLGFKADQFRQVVLLPQGDFRKLLLAGSSERQQIMQTLFHTQRYARLQELAKARHDTLAGQYEQVRQRREQCLADLGIASEEEMPDKEKAWQDKSAAVDAQWHEAETRRQTCQSAFQAAQTLENHWLLRDQKRREAAQLQDQAGQFQEKRDTIAILRQAEILAEPCRHLDDLEKEGKEALKAAEKARRLAEKAEKDLAEAQRQLAALSARESGYKAACEERVQLTGLQEKAGSYRDCCLEEERCRKAAGEAERRWDQVRQKKEAEKQALDKARESVAGLAEQAVAAEQAKARWQALSDRLQREGQAASLEEQLKEAGKQWQHSQNFLEKAAARARDERVAYESVRALFLQAQAAVLASELEEGKPCPVCGSAAHPMPAVRPDSLPERRDVEQHQKRADASEAKRQQWEVTAKADETRHQALKEQYDALRRQYPQDGTLADWQGKAEQARKAMEGLQQQLQAGEALKKAVAAGQARLSRWEKDEEAARTAAEQARTLAAKAAETKARLEADLPEAYRDLKALRDRVVAAGFESVKACRAMQAAVGQIPELEAAVRQYDTRVQQVQGQLAQEEKAIGSQPRPDVAAARTTLTEAEKASQALVEEKGSLAAQYRRWQQGKAALAALQQEGRDLTEAYKTVGAVYELIAGKQTGINFERYVLGALLDEVLAAANGRLQGMSRQRYSLQRSRSWDDKRVKQIGLDIEVYDNYTGYARPANTLSGGETFLASLSLALGLADVVL